MQPFPLPPVLLTTTRQFGQFVRYCGFRVYLSGNPSHRGMTTSSPPTRWTGRDRLVVRPQLIQPPLLSPATNPTPPTFTSNESFTHIRPLPHSFTSNQSTSPVFHQQSIYLPLFHQQSTYLPRLSLAINVPPPFFHQQPIPHTPPSLSFTSNQSTSSSFTSNQSTSPSFTSNQPTSPVFHQLNLPPPLSPAINLPPPSFTSNQSTSPLLSPATNPSYAPFPFFHHQPIHFPPLSPATNVLYDLLPLFPQQSIPLIILPPYTSNQSPPPPFFSFICNQTLIPLLLFHQQPIPYPPSPLSPATNPLSPLLSFTCNQNPHTPLQLFYQQHISLLCPFTFSTSTKFPSPFPFFTSNESPIPLTLFHLQPKPPYASPAL
ncbi:uncharacterized protein [Palaemon carinicauda]|uniref:uncharacterized protein n=1 Tax=Palaemon carinicauda TaxID=392227 RepID=UPI0035B682E0